MGDDDAKTAQLATNTVEPSKHTRITSDLGTQQSNADDWLHVNGGGSTGPGLLEYGFRREKVSRLLNPNFHVHDTNATTY